MAATQFLNRVEATSNRFHRPVCADVKGTAIGAGGLEFDSLVGQIRRSVATSAMFLGSCAVRALSRGPRHSLRASTMQRT